MQHAEFDIAINNVLIPDFHSLKFIPKNIGIKDGLIKALSNRKLKGEKTVDGKNGYLSPGLIDCHCHIESSFLIPSVFGDLVAKRGTLHVVADSHEIANIRGIEGVKFFINEAKNSRCNIRFAVPSCVPATDFATSGGRIDAKDAEELLKLDEVVSLGELMNTVAVINNDEKFVRMIDAAKKSGKRINGHAPHLTVQDLERYVKAGVEDDHESETYKELKQKIELGMKVFIREGSAEHTDSNAYRIIEEYPDEVMFCSDDKSVSDIISYGHLDYNLKKAVRLGIDPIVALKAATYNGLTYYKMNEFAEVKEGNAAYLVLFDKNFDVKAVFTETPVKKSKTKFNIPKIFLENINIKSIEKVPSIPGKIRNLCIGVNDGTLITDKIVLKDAPGEFDIENDILKLAVFQRYGGKNSAAARIKGFGLKRGAIASSVAHDCHNIMAVGVSDEMIKKAVNKVISGNGGLAAVDVSNEIFMPLPVAGIATDMPAEQVSEKLKLLKNQAKKMGSDLSDPFATLSFMALEVIGHIKLTDRGLFDVDRFAYI